MEAGDKPSSGMVGVLLGMKICKRVDVYGFDFSGYFNKSAWSHYYDKERPKPGREKVRMLRRVPAITVKPIYNVLLWFGNPVKDTSLNQ